MKPTVESVIIKYLSLKANKKKFHWGGVIEDHVRATLGSKGETTSRTLRFMENDGLVVATYEPVKGRRPCVKYKIA